MKATLIIACLLLPLLAAAQEKTARPPYQPGKWYAGVRRETYYLPARSRYLSDPTVPNTAMGTGFSLTGGYRLSRHVVLQAGLSPTRIMEDNGFRGTLLLAPNSERVNDTTLRSVTTGYSRYGLYVPVSIKYSPFEAHRRFRPYVSAGLGGVFSGTRKYTTLYNPLVSLMGCGDVIDARYERYYYSVEEERNGLTALFAAQAGLGLDVRLLNRVHLSSELLVNRNLRRNGLRGVNAAIGLLYDFKPRL